ncbi:hypothetical protein B9Z55_015949 [Caenorhabditis nigoni]|uniref:Protein-tyrosine-phosphatase n=1 Tax=Caenorhabditis nigoni TaxID=1611254 RepID=A0A2G5UCL9_9PELO|nr:hypothetical protein B9Z55_015949 [Caenorhabditis nigoni]
MIKSHYLAILGIIINGLHAHNHNAHHPPDEFHKGSPPIFKDPMSSSQDPPPDIPGIQDYPNPNDRMLSNSITSSVPNNDSPASPLDSHRLSDSPIIRKTRAASTNSQEFLDHVSIIARIANGISLQAGLMNNATNIEEVAVELLSFGDIPVSTIAEFKPDALNKFTTKLKEAPTALDSSIIAQEQQVLDFTELLKSSKTIGDLKDLPGKTEYFSYLKSLNSSVFNPIKRPGGYMVEAKTDIGKIKSSNDLSDQAQLKGLVRRFESLCDNLKNFFDAIEPFKTSLETLKNSELVNGPKAFEPIEKIIELILKRANFTTTLNDEGKTTTVSNLKSLSLLSEDSKGSTQDVNTLTSLSNTKSNPKFQKRRVTSGFPNGMSDVKQLARDVRNPWIAKILGTNGSLDSLNDGLLPLFRMNKKLADLDEKLAILSTQKLFQSLSNIRTVQKELSEVESEVDKMTEPVWDNMKNCQTDYNRLVDPNVFAPIRDVIDTIKTFTRISQFRLNEQNLDKSKTIVDKFIQNLGFTDLTNIDQSKKEAPAILQKLGSNGFDEIEKTVKELMDMFDDVKDFETKVKDVVSKERTPLPRQITNEQDLYRCLEAVQNTQKVAQAIMVAQNLRGRKNDDVKTVESAIKDISGVSKDLSSLKSLTTEMQKHPDVAPTDLNKFPNATAEFKVIGQSAASLRFAHGLKELNPEMAHLKDVDAIVQAEIPKISDPAQIKDLIDQWGDHNSNMESLDQTLAGIWSFESKLDVSKAKTLEEFSSPLKNLGTIPDAQINALEKSKVLEVLIAQPKIDPTVKSELEKAKQTLDKLAPLDLGFASHQSEFEKAPGAFKALQDFLVGFFTVQRKHMAASANNGSSIVSGPAKEADHTIMWIIIGVAVFLLVGGGIGGGIWAFLSHRKRQQEKLEQLEDEERDRIRREKEKEDRDRERKEHDEKEAAMEKEKQELEAQRKQEHDAREHEAARRKAAEDERRAASERRRAASQRRRAAEAEAAAERKKRETMAKDQQAKDQAQQVKDKVQFDIDMKTMLSGVEKWIRSHKYEYAGQMNGVLAEQMKIVATYQKRNNEDLKNASLQYLTTEKHRYPGSIPCLLETVVKFQFNGVDIKIHANHVVTKPTYSKNSKFGAAKVSMRFIATQGPLQNTLDDFWSMVWHFKVEFIIMLCCFEENGNVKCDAYFKANATGTFETELFKIDTVDFEPIFKGREAGWKRKFEVTLKKDPKGEKRTLVHYHYLDWPDKGVPNGHEDVRQLLEFVKDSKAPVVVHCSAGIGRTMCLIGTEYMAAEVKNNPNYTVAQGGIDLRNVRCNGIQTFEQMLWLVASVVYRLSNEFGYPLDIYKELVKQIKEAQKLTFQKDIELKMKKAADFREGDMDEGPLRELVEKEKKEEEEKVKGKGKNKKQRKKGGTDTRIEMEFDEDVEEVDGPGVEVIELEDEEEES